MLRQALDELGGTQYLVEVGRTRPDLFCALVAKLIPNEVKASLEHHSAPLVQVFDYTGQPVTELPPAPKVIDVAAVQREA